MASRSATILVIFIVAIIAFCLATVFASMTGPISILPNASNNGSSLNNISTIANNVSVNTGNSHSYDYHKSSDNSKDTSSKTDGSNVETTSDSSQQKNSGGSNVETTPDSSGSNVETTKDSSSSGSGGSNVVTTTG